MSRPVLAAVSALLLTVGLAACDASGATINDDDSSSRAAVEASEAPEVAIQANVRRGEPVPVDRIVNVTAAGGTLSAVKVRVRQAGELAEDDGDVAGDLRAGGSAWRAAERLEPGTAYVVTARAESPGGEQTSRSIRFRTEDLTLDDLTFPSVSPLDGETVGVGMPAIVTFDVPVTDKASIERHLRVTSTPQQPGAWHWLSDTEVHWRPKTYWKAGTDVVVDVDVNSVPAGNGIYGQKSRRVEFHVGDEHIYKVDAKAHQMKVFSNGKLLRTFPITTGKPGFTTRSGVKVIMEKFESRRMNSETVGIPQGSAEAWDIDDVKWAMRLTHSGEFIHAAPWSVGSQGHANVSHGCTGMSTEDAGWLYAMSRRGDVVEYVGTDRPMTLENGYGDWNLPFSEYRKGSALR